MCRGILSIIITFGFMVAAAAPAAAVTRTWDGGGADNNWMNALNWNNDDAPDPGDDLLFPANVVDTVMVNNFPAGTKFGVLAFAGPYIVDGNRILIGSGIVHLGAGGVIFHTDISLEGGLGALGTITFRVEDLGSFIQIDGVISGSSIQLPATLRKNGAGLLRLSAASANTYGGVTAIEEGELRIHHSTALGSTGANTIVSDGAVLGIDLAGNATVSEPLVLAGQGTAAADDGALVFRAPATLAGTIALFGASTPHIVVAFVGTATISGAIEGGNGIIKSGTGALTLSGNNTYTGMTTVAGGSLQISHAQALSSPSSGTTVLGGGNLNMLVPTIADEPLFAQANGSGTPVIRCAGPAVCTWGGPIVVQGENSFNTEAGSTLKLTGDISGAGAVSFSGGGAAELLGHNTYTGKTVVGDVKLSGGQAVPDGSRVQLVVAAALRLNAAETIGALTGDSSGKVMMNGWTLTIDSPDSWPEFGGIISGPGGLTKKGAGTFAINNPQLYNGLTTVEAGVFKMLPNTVLPGPVKLTGGVLRGTATVGDLTAMGGRVEPGQSAGILTAKSANLLGGTLALELNGPTAGTQHDQVRVTTGVSLSNVTLELSAASMDAFSTPLVIVKNDGPNAVTGIFAGLDEGAMAFPSNGRAVRITYKGGDGNDIVLSLAEASYYLSEGATGPFFDTDILIANPSAAAVEATLTFLLPDGTSKVETRNIEGRSRLTVKVDDIAGLQATAVSTVVTSASGLPLVVERTMRWDGSGYGAHTEKAVSGTSRHWYFAEGSQGFFSTFLLLANPQSSPNVATVHYLRENAEAIVRQYPVAANSRFTVDVGADSELVGSSFGMHVSFDQAGVAERAMYFGSDPFWKAGHESAGVIEPSATWFLAEGATGPFFETFVLLANPGNQPAEATVTFLPDTGVPVVKTVPIPALGRVTLNIEAEDASLANAAVATQVSATQPILVERAQYWPDPAPQWYEAHNSFGVTAVGTKWGLAEGRCGGSQAYQTYILLANPGSVKANVTVTFLREGQGPVEKTYEVNPQSRFNVDTGAVPELANLSFGAVITSDQPIAVERAMYNNANGQMWAAGTNATATPLP